MPNLQDSLNVYLWRPWEVVSLGLSFLIKAFRPAWLRGCAISENTSARDYAFGELYQKLAEPFKDFEDKFTPVRALVASAHGTVVDVGPGVGLGLDRFDRSKIDHIFGVEPNPAFVAPLLAKVEETGLQGKYTLVLGRAEDEKLLAEHGIKEGTVDSVVCLQTLCSVADPEQVMRHLWKLLKPGGVFIFWEHQRSHYFLPRIVQEIWNPLWSLAMGGCSLNRPIGKIILNAGDWDHEASKFEEVNHAVSGAGPTLLPRVQGTMVRRA